jgi:hypothetical protein
VVLARVEHDIVEMRRAPRRDDDLARRGTQL